MAEKEQLYKKEEYDVKYMRELLEYWEAYSYALINEIYTGVAINLGMPSDKAYKLAKNNPKELKKAGFFSSIFDKFKTIFSYKVPKFRYKKKNLYNEGKPLTPKQWEGFNKYMSDFWTEHANKVAEDMGIKAYMLGTETTKYREKKKPYKNKSLQQINIEFDGEMPANITEAYRKYDFTNSEKKINNKALSDIAMYVTQTDNQLQEAIRQQIQLGIENNKGPQEIASDLYWQVEKNENLVNKYTAEALRKNWSRIASTELADVYETGILAPYESQAMESMDDSKKAVYFARSGGTCKWCLSKRGTIVRLVPTSIVKDTKDESLRNMGINDPVTDIAIWPGKNNIGLKQADWLICCPAHPHNVATFIPIDPGEQEYNQKTDDVEYKSKKERFVPQMEDYSSKSREEKKDRKPKKIGGGKVSFNNNIYIGVQPDEYNEKLEKWRKNPSMPIPVNINSPQYRELFGAAE